jgi:hypothetical protein
MQLTSKLSVLFLMLLALVAPSYSIATNKVGNGGNMVRCHVAGKSKASLLDFYEAAIDPQFDTKSTMSIGEEVLNRMKVGAPKLAEQYLKRLKLIQSEMAFENDIQLLEIPDSQHLFKPLSKDCEILQIAVRKKLVLDSEKRFLIRKDLWDQLTPAHQAGLLTHEIIHEHFTKLGEENSIKARKINAYIYSVNFKSEVFWKLIKDLEIPIYP